MLKRGIQIQSLFIFLLLLTSIKTKAQNKNIVQDKKIDALVNEHIAFSDKKGTVSGYRVQIHFGSDREKSKEAKAKFLKSYPEIAAYENYQQPNFKVRVGDFRTPLEAQKFLKEIQTEFSSSFIVNDDINYPKLY